jgi:hypothetical protein
VRGKTTSDIPQDSSEIRKYREECILKRAKTDNNPGFTAMVPVNTLIIKGAV